MPGVRVQHPTERNCTYVLVDATQPYRPPYACPACHTIHQFKTFHIKLDEAGAAIVSVEVHERLKRIPFNPFDTSNEVERPPEQKLWLPTNMLKVEARQT